jgi:hypothetical protein
MRRLLFVLVLASTTFGCGRGFDLVLPDRFVELHDPMVRGEYELRATTPDGVVMGVDVVANGDQGTLAFYREAILRRMRDQQGYALISQHPIHAASGQDGHLMRFGRDLNGHAYRYTLAVFASPSSAIILVEAGGRQEQFSPLQARIEQSIERIRF